MLPPYENILGVRSLIGGSLNEAFRFAGFNKEAFRGLDALINHNYFFKRYRDYFDAAGLDPCEMMVEKSTVAYLATCWKSACEFYNLLS